jgi:DNA mismatch repair protein MutS2
VLADVGDEQSIEMSLSTFSGAPPQHRRDPRAATERSLVLLDELAAGTDPSRARRSRRRSSRGSRGRRG